jgi:hypothetical protein
MKCDEAKALQGAYLDSELDARTTLQIEQHLASCPECRNFFAEESKQETRMRSLLNRGEKTGALWEQIERRVGKAGVAGRSGRSSAVIRESVADRGVLGALGERLRAGWERSRWGWSAMAAAWAVVFALNFTAREPRSPAGVTQSLPPASELRLALKQKQLLSAGLAALSDPRPAVAAKPAPHTPRSDRRNENLNS